jgi:hypothetical protein
MLFYLQSLSSKCERFYIIREMRILQSGGDILVNHMEILHVLRLLQDNNLEVGLQPAAYRNCQSPLIPPWEGVRFQAFLTEIRI